MPGKLNERAEGFLLGTVVASAVYAAYAWLKSRKLKAGFSTEDRSLFYGPSGELTKIVPDARFLPKELYSQVGTVIIMLSHCLMKGPTSTMRLLYVAPLTGGTTAPHPMHRHLSATVIRRQVPACEARYRAGEGLLVGSRWQDPPR
jgi:hypothetical protein